MRPFLPLLAVTMFLSTASISLAQAPFMPAPIDVGDLTSDGAGGWNYLVRPLAPDETAPGRIDVPGGPPLYLVPPPVTPAQSSIVLLAGEPLVFTIPNSAGWSLQVTHEMEDQEIDVHITRSSGLITEGFSSPYEYLLPLGTLPADDYRLNLTFFTSPFGDLAPPQVSVGYIPFTVAAIPTPGTLSLMLPAIAVGLLAQRRLRPHRSGK